MDMFFAILITAFIVGFIYLFASIDYYVHKSQNKDKIGEKFYHHGKELNYSVGKKITAKEFKEKISKLSLVKRGPFKYSLFTNGSYYEIYKGRKPLDGETDSLVRDRSNYIHAGIIILDGEIRDAKNFIEFLLIERIIRKKYNELIY